MKRTGWAPWLRRESRRLCNCGQIKSVAVSRTSYVSIKAFSNQALTVCPVVGRMRPDNRSFRELIRPFS
jgi:hypothetical protein